MEASLCATDGVRWRDALDPAVERRVEGTIDALAQLRVLDATVLRILDVVDDPDANTAAIVAVLEEDPGFAANLLRFANSAARAHPVRSKTVRQAVMLVGRRALRRLALEAATYRFLEAARGTGAATRGDLVIHAVQVATASAVAAERLGAPGDMAHLAGLLHDVGKLVMPHAFGVDGCIGLPTDGGERALAERDRFGIDHALAGALLAERWQLPEPVAAAIALHHGGPTGLESPDRDVAAVQLANELERVLAGGRPDHPLVDVALRRCAVEAPFLDELARRVRPSHALPEDGALGRSVAEVDGLSQTDDLTGAHNRRHWLQATLAALAERGAGTVVVCRVAGLDAVEEAHGERVADAVLGDVARVLGHHGRVGRVAAERFAIWARPGGAPDLPAIAATVRASLTERDAALPARVELGAASAPADGETLAELLGAAGLRLHEPPVAEPASPRPDRAPAATGAWAAAARLPELQPALSRAR